MILHLVNDDKFLEGTTRFFERYYNNQNHYIVQKSISDKRKAEDLPSKRVFYRSFISKIDVGFVLQYAELNDIEHILIHHLSPAKAVLTEKIKKVLNVKIYWIFYGTDLYSYLNDQGLYTLHDQPKLEKRNYLQQKYSKLKFWLLFRKNHKAVMKSFIKQLDYFCFWNEYDFKLLKEYFDTEAIHKYFLYYHLLDRHASSEYFRKNFGEVIINHSASGNGNHRTILDKLSKLDSRSKLDKIIAPLSYGNEGVRIDTVEHGHKLFGSKFQPLIEFMPMEQYYQLLNEIPVAIYGNRRQEAGANVFYLLSRGAKIFLRNDNNMIYWLRDRGFKVFSFEDDLNSIDDLTPLSLSEMESNMNLHKTIFSKEMEEKTMMELIDA